MAKLEYAVSRQWRNQEHLWWSNADGGEMRIPPVGIGLEAAEKMATRDVSEEQMVLLARRQAAPCMVRIVAGGDESLPAVCTPISSTKLSIRIGDLQIVVRVVHDL
jgi:hypothetical protein